MGNHQKCVDLLIKNGASLFDSCCFSYNTYGDGDDLLPSLIPHRVLREFVQDKGSMEETSGPWLMDCYTFMNPMSNVFLAASYGNPLLSNYLKEISDFNLLYLPLSSTAFVKKEPGSIYAFVKGVSGSINKVDIENSYPYN